MRADRDFAIVTDADARLLAPDVRPPRTSWSWAQNRAFFGQSLVDGGLRGGAQFAVDFMLISMSEQLRQQGVGPTEFAYLVGGQERRQALLPVVVAAFDLAFGLGGWGIAQRDAIEMECGTQLGESIWIMGVEEGVVVNVEGQRQAMDLEDAREEVKMSQECFSGVEVSTRVKASGVIQEVQEDLLVGRARQPGMGAGVVLPESAQVTDLPAFDRFGGLFITGVWGQVVL